MNNKMNNNKIKLNRRYVNEIQYVNLVEKHWLVSFLEVRMRVTYNSLLSMFVCHR